MTAASLWSGRYAGDSGVTTAIIMDPPSYGRGPGGEVWKLEENLWPFVSLCAGVLSDEPLFVIINSYTTGLSASVLSYVTESIFTKKFGGRFRQPGAGAAGDRQRPLASPAARRVDGKDNEPKRRSKVRRTPFPAPVPLLLLPESNPLRLGFDSGDKTVWGPRRRFPSAGSHLRRGAET